MQKYGWRFFPVIPTGAWQTYQTRAGALGNYGVVDLDCKKQILLWASPTPTKGNCWSCLRTAGGVPTPHGSAVESHGVSLFFPAAFSYWACAHSNVLALYTFTNPDTVHWGSNVLFEFFISIKFLSLDVKIYLDILHLSHLIHYILSYPTFFSHFVPPIYLTLLMNLILIPP